MNIGRGLYNMFVVAMASIAWIAALKLVTAKYPQFFPGIAEIVAIV